MDAGKALSRQMSLKTIPEIDTYTFGQIAAHAGAYSATSATTSNAYSLLLAAQEALGNANVPDTGRVCLCSYSYAGLLKQDPAFMRDCDVAQNSLIKGMLGEVDGCKIVKVPASRLPYGCQFILCHPIATVNAKVLSEYRVHTDAPGVSGWLVEGRFSYDTHVLKNKKDAIYYSGPFSASERTLVLNKGESITIDAVNYGAATVSAACKKGSSSTSDITATVTGGSVAIAAIAAATAGTDYTVTLTESVGSTTTTINVTVV